jgi:D-serine dehydratase
MCIIVILYSIDDYGKLAVNKGNERISNNSSSYFVITSCHSLQLNFAYARRARNRQLQLDEKDRLMIHFLLLVFITH